MKRALFRGIACAALSLTMILPLRAQETPVILDGEVLPLSASLENGVTYVPLRAFGDSLGCTVSWDGSRGAASISGAVSADFFPGSDSAWYRSARQTLSGASYVRDGRTYVPLRALASAAGWGISYENGGVALDRTRDYIAPYTADDLYWLARIIQAESGGEPYAGKLAVGAVVLNRVAHPAWPDTVWGVIFDRNNGVQFTPAATGTVYCTPSAESVAAARECLAGVRSVGNCLYFFNPETATKAAWIRENCVFVRQIGGHAFYWEK